MQGLTGGQNTTANTGATGQQDALGQSNPLCWMIEADPIDKGVDGILGKAGHKQNAGTTEKISDGIRSAFKKVRLYILVQGRC